MMRFIFSDDRREAQWIMAIAFFIGIFLIVQAAMWIGYLAALDDVVRVLGRHEKTGAPSDAPASSVKANFARAD